MSKYRIFVILSVVFLSAVLIFSALYIWGGHNNAAKTNTGYLDQSSLAAINVSSPGVFVSSSNSTIYVNNSANLPIMTGPMNAPSMYSFEILGIINPEIIIREGSNVHFTAINVDTDSYHNFVIGNSGPPFGYMGGNGMMGNGGNDLMGTMQYLPPTSNGHYAYANLTYSFSSPGTYWYLCTYPGHAENGMYGKIVVT